MVWRRDARTEGNDKECLQRLQEQGRVDVQGHFRHASDKGGREFVACETEATDIAPVGLTLLST